MSRLLMLIAIAVVIYLLIKSYRKKTPQQDKKIAEDMVRCTHCGVHLPKGESIQTDERFFCSAEHRDAYRKKTM
ncbi:MAG: PP0621 family protein [Gallionella sp.]|nr:PP0621 family protein [Gallionella sp.]